MTTVNEARTIIRAHENAVAEKVANESKIRKLWKTGCITQAQLAKIFDCSQSNISRIISEG